MLDRMATVRTRDPRRRAVRRLRETGRAYVHFALAEPGLFEVAFSTPIAEHGDGGPYALLNQVLDELVDVGALPPDRAPGRRRHVLGRRARLRDAAPARPAARRPRAGARAVLDRCLDLVELALVPWIRWTRHVNDH